MGRVRQAQTTGELEVAATLRKLGGAYRKNVGRLPGSPDFANRRRKWAVFVNGCFWHLHTGCPRATVPKANNAFWVEKFAANRLRDARAVCALRRAGFRVAIVWECEVSAAGAKLRRLLAAQPRDP
jgi:DNA mismatch endonuclease (patch repair protein)